MVYFSQSRPLSTHERPDHDVIIVGAGFMGIYLAYRMKTANLSATIYEAGGGVGGTWYWNRYPGAACDIESLEYSYSFSSELEQEWTWSRRFPPQKEIEDYLNHVTDRFGLRDMMHFNTRIQAARYDEREKLWRVALSNGQDVTARFVVFAVGELSEPSPVTIAGVERFAGRVLHTFGWPEDEVRFRGKRVAVIGTGSSAIQIIPEIASDAESLTVFQRTPNFSIPVNDQPMDPDFEREVKDSIQSLRRIERNSNTGVDLKMATLEHTSEGATDDEIEAEFERRYEAGGLYLMSSYTDIMTNEDINEKLAEFVRRRIREKVKDPELARLLTPTGYPFGAKRPCADRNYFETFNRDNVHLVDLKSDPIEEITPEGIRTSKSLHEFDIIVFATGFDAVTGAIGKIDIQGRSGRQLKDHWAQGPRTVFGFMSNGFPNMFMANIAHCPYDTYNTIRGVEFTGEWISDMIEHMRREIFVSVEPTADAEDDFTRLVSEIAEGTLLVKADSWYLGANVPGKPRVALSWFGGFRSYRAKVQEAVRDGYSGFHFEDA